MASSREPQRGDKLGRLRARPGTARAARRTEPRVLPRCGRPVPPVSPDPPTGSPADGPGPGAPRLPVPGGSSSRRRRRRRRRGSPGPPSARPSRLAARRGSARRRRRGSAGAPRTWAEGGQSSAAGSQERVPRRRHRPGPRGRCHRRARPPRGRHRLRRGRRLARAGGPWRALGPGHGGRTGGAGGWREGVAGSGAQAALGRALGAGGAAGRLLAPPCAEGGFGWNVPRRSAGF